MKKIKTIALAVIMIVGSTSMAFAQDGHDQLHNGYGYYGNHFGGMHMMWWFVWIMFIFLIFGLFQPVSRRKIKENAPMEILKRKFASCEITKEEYEARKIVLEKN